MLIGRFVSSILLLCAVVCTPSFQNASAQNASASFTEGKERFQSESIARDGFNLFYRSLGSGKPVLILSGGPGDDCDYMLPVASEVARHHRAILLEQRGTGRSLPPHIDAGTISLSRYLEDFESIRQHLGVERWTVIGHSAGGVLAMEYAAAHPDRIDKLILLDSVPVAFEYLMAFEDNLLDRMAPDQRERQDSLEKTDSAESREQAAELEMDGMFFNRTLGRQLSGQLSHAWHADVGRLLGSEITAPGYDLRPRLKNFDRPVLVLHGRQDPMDPWMAYQTSAAFRHSTLHFIDRAGHFPWFDQPDIFNAILDSYLQQP
jgi:proline iminopeptidase